MKRIVKNRSLYEIKTVLLIEKCICLTILLVDSVYKFSEMYLSYSLNFPTNK